MSHCKLITFKEDVAAEYQEFGNSWGGAARIWMSVFDRYLKDPTNEHDNVLTAISREGPRAQQVWDVWKRPNLSDAAKAVWLCTFDDVLVMQPDFNQFALDLREFVREFATTGGCHLPAWADFVEHHADVQAIGFHHTSVCPNPWCGWDDEKDEPVPYSLATGTKHWSLYEKLRGFIAESAVPA